MERKVLIITGPTCSGKTYLSLKLAAYLGTEIISADSRQIYKYLNIGTAKPEPEQLRAAKHHFIDELLPDEEFNVSKFENESVDIINNLHERQKIPIVAGGTGLYIHALVNGIFSTVDTDEKYRDELMQKMEVYGKEYLYDELKKVDPESAEKMLPQNWKRVMRALEVYHLTGEPIWKHQKEYSRENDFEFLLIGLNWNREVLYQNIEQRVDEMIEKGLVEEVKNILGLGYNKDLNALNTVGYKEIIAFLEGECDLSRSIELIKRNTRRFAKRQMTWFRRYEDITWFNINTPIELDTVHLKILQLLKHQ